MPRVQVPLDFERSVERLIRSGELDVGLRDFDDDVLIGRSTLTESDHRLLRDLVWRNNRPYSFQAEISKCAASDTSRYG